MDAMRSHRSQAGLLIVAVVAASFLGGCSGAGASATPAGPTSVDVTLQEWAIAPSTTTLQAGKVTFNAKNMGPTDEHEMVVIRSDLPLLGLPTGSDGKVDEEGAGLTALGEVAELAVGASGSVTVDLAAGRYLLICNIVDADGDAHYGKGMASELTVR